MEYTIDRQYSITLDTIEEVENLIYYNMITPLYTTLGHRVSVEFSESRRVISYSPISSKNISNENFEIIIKYFHQMYLDGKIIFYHFNESLHKEFDKFMDNLDLNDFEMLKTIFKLSCHKIGANQLYLSFKGIYGFFELSIRNMDYLSCSFSSIEPSLVRNSSFLSDEIITSLIMKKYIKIV